MKKIKKLAVLAALIAGAGTLYEVSLATMQERSPLVNNLPANQQSGSTFSNSSVTASSRKAVLVNSQTIDSTKFNHFIPALAQNHRSPVNQAEPKAQDKAKFQSMMQYAAKRQLYKRSLAQIVQEIAQQFIGTPYQANLLDSDNQETLVVTLNKFDCVLFVETVLAIARGVAVQNYSYPTFVEHLTDQRYRNAHIDGYCSRLHYFSDWIADNQKRGIVRDMARDLGGVTLHKKLNFMSQHKRLYPPLVSNDANYQCMVAMETRLNQLEINYIPVSKIRSVYGKLQSGDIVAVATSIDGLDVTHTGLVYRTKNGNIGLIHAAPGRGVKISSDLQTYVGRIEHSVGILLARPVDSR